MSRKRKAKHEPGTIFRSEEDGALVRFNEHGEKEPPPTSPASSKTPAASPRSATGKR